MDMPRSQRCVSSGSVPRSPTVFNLWLSNNQRRVPTSPPYSPPLNHGSSVYPTQPDELLGNADPTAPHSAVPVRFSSRNHLYNLMWLPSLVYTKNQRYAYPQSMPT